MRLPKSLIAMSLGAVLSFSLPSLAAAQAVTELPTIGSVAPAFGLYAFPTQGSVKNSKADEWEIVQLDDLCGIRPGDTKAVLVLFVDNDPNVLGADPVGNWYRKYRKDGLEILVISVEKNPSIFATKVLRTKPRFPVLDDRQGVVAKRYGVKDAPFSFVLDAQCKVVGFDDKSASASAPALTAAIENLVRDTPIEKAAKSTN
ncbi:MAG: hypothetical protein CMP23_01440 [Rickettsiales bacterium]|nr:hypothetical protein [Rickettsiales bacterium]|tara:strand:- start:1430 stop:2035 length:606 start_codon:yes stop_codon:yes gene_type:complete